MKTKNLITIIAHQDDEICLFNRIYNFKNKNNVYIFYLTSGLNKTLNKNNINYYFLILTGILMLYLFNPFINPSGIHISANLQSVLFSAAFLMLLFLLID